MAAMNLGEEAAESLNCLKDLSDGELQALAQAVASVLLGLQREDAALNGPIFEQLEVELIKKVYSSLVCLFVEAAKNDESEAVVSSFLRSECGVPEAQGEVIAEVFVSKKEELRKVLCGIGNFSYLPRLSGVDWRLEYRVSSSEDQPPRELLYHISMKTVEKEEDFKADGKTDFVCSVEQLQDLVSSLKDACKAVERVVHQG